jgi:sugar O-acyltransferase (sialic acid O-acetyltransferase NeuD family)
METKKLTILGFSEAALTMIFDIFESNENFPKVDIINNLKLTPSKKYHNKNFSIEEFFEVNKNKSSFLLGGVKPNTKEKIRNSYPNIKDSDFINIFSKNSEISSTTLLGNGIIVNTMSSIAGFSEIKNFVFINRNCSIGHHTIINEYTTLNPGANVAGNVIVGKNCQIGMGSNIIDGITIGNNVIIGAGSVVTKNIPDNVVAYGNPCKIIRENV